MSHSHQLIATELQKTGLCVWPRYFSRKSFLATRVDLDATYARGDFKRAGTGQGAGHHIQDQVRRDEVHWLTRGTVNLAQQALWKSMDALKTAFNRTAFLGLSGFEGHYATYAKGGFYRRHLDCFKKDGARKVSVVLYLNKNWKAADGGRLRVYDTEGDAHTDVDPIGGTLVAFLSGESEHEVLLSHAPRFSFVGWFT